MSLKKTVTCLIFYKLKKLEPIVGFSAHYIVTVLAYKTCTTFDLSSRLFTVLCNLSGWHKMKHFSHYCQVKINMPINNDHILIKNLHQLKGTPQYAPAPCRLPVGGRLAVASAGRPPTGCSQLRPDVCDRQTSDRCGTLLNAPYHRGRGIITGIDNCAHNLAEIGS